MAGQIFDSAPPALLQQAHAAAAWRECWIRRASSESAHAFRQPALFQAGDNATHGWRFHLFGRRQLAQRHGPAENQHRQCREPGRTFAGSGILLAYPAQQMNGRGMQPVGITAVASGGAIFLLAFGHEI